MKPRRPHWLGTLVLVALGIAAVVLAVRILVRFPDGSWRAAGLLALAVIALARVLARAGNDVPGIGWRLRERLRQPGVRAPGILVFFAGLATVIAFIRRWEVDLGPAGWDVGAPWLISLLLVGLVAWWPVVGPWLAARRTGAAPSWSPPPARAWLPWVVMTLLAGMLRLLAPGRYPPLISGDEGEYLQIAISARDGTMINPFSTGWLEVPHLYPAVEGWITWLVGDSLGGYRLLGGVVGTIGVLATWRFGRYVVGPWPAFAGAALLAVLPFHLVFSRSALNHILDPTSLILTLLFLWRAVHGGRRGDAWLSGAMVGLGWYGYWGARAFPAIVIVILVIVATDRRVGWWHAIRLGLWSALGFVVMAGPLLVTFLMHPGLFRNRFEQVAPAEAGTWRDDPIAYLDIYLDHLRETAVFPFVENLVIWYRHDAPFFGWPISLLIAIGTAAWIAGIVHGRDWRAVAWLGAPWVVLTLGLAATIQIESQRFISLLPIWMLLAGCGIVAIARWVTSLGAPDRPLARSVVTVGLVATLAVSNLGWATADERQLVNWGDMHTVTAWDIGWRLSNAPGEGAGVPVAMAGAPHLFLGAWDNLTFQAPGAIVTDIEGTTIDPNAPPLLQDGTLLLLTFERAAERCHVETIYPGVSVAEVRARNGALLYLAFYRGTLHGWDTGESPEGTTWSPLAAEPCPTVGSAGPES